MAMLIIQGAKKLSGEILVQGSKNSVLPILIATILCEGKSYIYNYPKLSDVDATEKILEHIGCKVIKANNCIAVDSGNMNESTIPEFLMRELRSSIIFLGALLGKEGKANISFPGGCEIGLRPIDLHIKALKQMGVIISETHGYLECIAPNGLKGANISLSFPSVGATENIILAAVLAKGVTTITNAAQEPEIVDLANYLNKCGAKINGMGKSTIYIEGVKKLKGTDYKIIPDRIAAITYMCMAAGTNGEIKLKNVNTEHIKQVMDLFLEMGCKTYKDSDSLYLKATGLKPLKLVRTMPYPGFPTDAQALIMAPACIADGTSVFIENIFENRYKHVGELNRMGANIKVEGRMAVVEGVNKLFGAKLTATDLRAAASLTIAALMANGQSSINGIKYLNRGYENIEKNLKSIGADIKIIQWGQNG